MTDTLIQLDSAQLNLLDQVAGLQKMPTGAFNIRMNGSSIGMASTPNVAITPKENRSGLTINIMPGARETIHIPVIISDTGLAETVLNDFFVGDGADVTIVAGCGIHNCGSGLSQHDGIHTFYVGKDARVVYTEKHYGSGDGTGKRVLNPVTDVHMEPGSYMEIDTVQIKEIGRAHV